MLTAALPVAAIVAAAALSTNWLAHGTISPPYAHRAAAARPLPAGIVLRDGESWNPDNWYDYSLRLSNGKLLTSYWNKPQGVDRDVGLTGDPRRAAGGRRLEIDSFEPSGDVSIPGAGSTCRRQPAPHARVPSRGQTRAQQR
jgi:hypothetical protein